MSGIEEVIERSRKGGGFAERKRFTLARHHAVRKMREFALAAPSYYVLELIQSAVANGATSINVDFDGSNMVFSYVGGSVRRDEMAHLFDYLFASKDRLEMGHLRELALGINALMLYEPDEIILESGDGSFEGTHRMVLKGKGDAIEMGQSDAPLRGTFIQATGLKRIKLSLKGFSGEGEQSAIETRCLTAPVPILINGDAPFGFRSYRIPLLWGHDPVRNFDEDDLFGVVGLSPFTTAAIRLTTHGVWIQTLEESLVRGANVGGIVNFDRLRKTADHAAIVRDDVFEEMLVRVRPYAQSLVRGESAATLHQVRLMGGETLLPKELKPFLLDAQRVVVVPIEAEGNPELRRRSERIGERLGCPVLCCPDTEVLSVRLMAGEDTSVVAPDVVSRDDCDFYELEPAEPPPLPYLVSPLQIETLALGDVGAELDMSSGGDGIALRLGGVGKIEALLYAPASPGPARGGVWVRLINADRVVWQGLLPSAFAGQWLEIRVPDVSPGHLLTPLGGAPLAELLCRAMLRRAEPQQAELGRRVLGALSRAQGDLGPFGRRTALEALARSTVLRLRKGRGVRVSCYRGSDALMALPAFKTLSGDIMDIRGLCELLAQTHGLLYGVIPEVPADLEGLDRSRILELESEAERTLVSMFGDGCYVRVDRRDLLAESHGVQCRDLALGLQSYPDFPLPVEGRDPSTLSEPERAKCLSELLTGLVELYLGNQPPRPKEPGQLWDWQENRRHAGRHLTWFVCRRLADEGNADLMGLEDLLLFRSSRGNGVSVAQLAAGMAAGSLTLDFGSCPVGANPQGEQITSGGPTSLVVSPFVHGLVAPLGQVRLAFDFDFDDAEARANAATPEVAFLQTAEVSSRSRGFKGVIGVPTDPAVTGEILVTNMAGKRVGVIDALAWELGVVGYLRVSGDPDLDDIQAAVDRAIDGLMHGLAERLGTLRREGGPVDRAESALLRFAEHYLVLEAGVGGEVEPTTHRPTAQLILDQPLFDLGDGESATGWQIVGEFCQRGALALTEAGGRTLCQRALREAGTSKAQWLRTVLRDERVTRLGHAPKAVEIGRLPLLIWKNRRAVCPGCGETWTADQTSGNRGTRPGEICPSCGETTRFSFGVVGKEKSIQLVNNLMYWLESLRTDGHHAPIRSDIGIGVELVQPVDFASELPWALHTNELCRYVEEKGVNGKVASSSLFLNAQHGLTQKALREMYDPEALGWLLLGCYAEVNRELHPVTNEHEQQFQIRVFNALEAGQLKYLELLPA